MASFGKLILTLPDGQEQEFELGKETVTLGRAMTNDIVLPDVRVSRQHARLDCGPEGCTLVDQGSANGTRVNGAQVKSALLSPGDVVSLGNSSLRYDINAPTVDQELTMIDSEADLDATLGQMTLAMTLNDTSKPRLVVYTPERTWEMPLEVDALSIGRAPDNDVVLEIEKVSRHHARLERQRDAFLLRDLKSTNGTYIAGERIEMRLLKDGDVFRIGPAQLVYKSGFMQEELTLFGERPESLIPTRRPVVFVPGMMGSELWQGSERVWPNVKILFKNPELYRLTEDSPLEPLGLVGEVVIVPNLVKLEKYNRLGDYLVEELGYQRENDLLEFSYDWRRDVRDSARKLAEAIDGWDVTPPVTIIAHSLGTLVSRYYVERLGGKKKVERLLLMGGPHLGVPKAATSLLLGPNLLPFGLLGERLRQVLATFPSSYQILPTYACVVDQNKKRIAPLEDESWVTEDQRQFLRAARQFRRELGNRSSVPAVSIFGYGLKTVSTIFMERDITGLFRNVNYEVAPCGDITVPETSAVLQGSEIHPVQQYHGSLYVDNDVKMRLKLELTRK